MEGSTEILTNHVPTNTRSSQGESQLYTLEGSKAVIKMIIKGRSPTMRHVSRSDKVALDLLFDRINLEPEIQIKYVDTKNQFANMLTTESFTRDEWNHLLRLFNIVSFLIVRLQSCSNFLSDPTGKQSAMSKSGQEATSSEGSPMAKPKPMILAKARPMNLVFVQPVECEEKPSRRSERSSQPQECR